MPTTPKKGSSWGVVLVIAIVLIAAYVAYADYSGMWPFTPKEIACTMEAKQCPDGSYVGRTGPNCEFAECPSATSGGTADWLTYTNTDGKYSFKYPSAWNALTNQYMARDAIFGTDASVTSGPGGVEIRDFTGSIDEFLAGVEAQYSDKQDIVIAGLPGIRSSYSSGSIRGVAYVLKRDNQIINIYIFANGSDSPDVLSEDASILEDLVSTFKFID